VRSTSIPPHLDGRAPLLTTRRGSLWIPGDVVEAGSVHVQSGPMFVEWEAPEQVIRPYPVILVHGGGGQGTDWMTTPDGRPGWSRLLVEAGYVVYVVDRVGHGRSPYHPDVIGPMGGQLPYEVGRMLFADDSAAEAQTAWTWAREPGTAVFDQLMAAMGPLPADLADSQRLDADRLAKLLDRVGPAILVTHSAGGPVGWLATDARPELVTAVVAVEPMGPAFVEFPGMGTLSWGLTAARITTEPTYTSAEHAQAAGPGALTLPALKGKPVALVTGGASGFGAFRNEILSILERSGARAEGLHLPDLGIEGNGHGLIFETNSAEILTKVVGWLERLEHEEERN
jgi:pimeloyl-ACP methyl ester carboxylesterase